MAGAWTGVFETLAKNFTINGAAVPNTNAIKFSNNFEGKENDAYLFDDCYVTARVIYVLPNGQLVIRGCQGGSAQQRDPNSSPSGGHPYGRYFFEQCDLSTYIADARIELTAAVP